MVSTILLCLGSSIAVFVIARILQGGSSAITWTAGLALLVDTVGQHRLGRAMGFCSVGMNAALLLAPFVGGLVLDRSGYVSVFVITLGIIAVDLVLRFLVVEKATAQHYFKKTTSYWIITYGFHGTPSISPSPCAEIAELDAPLLASYEEATCDDPPDRACSNARRCIKLPPVISLLRFGRLRVLLWVTLVEITVMAAFDAVLPLFTYKVFGWGSVGAGLIFVPLVLPALMAPWIGDLSDRYGARLFILAGFVSATPTLITLRVITNNTIGHIILLCTLLSLLSLAMALIMAPVMAEIMYVVEAEEKQQPGIFGRKGAYAQAYALYAFASAAGLLLGPCLGGLLTEAAGWGTMTLTLGLLCAVTAAPVFYWL